MKHYVKYRHSISATELSGIRGSIHRKMRKAADAHILGATVLPADSRTCIEFIRQLYPQRFCDRVCGVSVVFGFERHIYLTPKLMTAKGLHCTRSHPRKIAYLPRLIADSPGAVPLAAGIRSIGIRAARNVLRSRCNVAVILAINGANDLTSLQRTNHISQHHPLNARQSHAHLPF